MGGCQSTKQDDISPVRETANPAHCLDHEDPEEVGKFNENQRVSIIRKKRKVRNDLIFSEAPKLARPSAPAEPIKQEEEKEAIVVALHSNRLLNSLTLQEKGLFVEYSTKFIAEAGCVVIEQGDDGDFFYIVSSGELAFIVDGKKVGSCGPGDSFGELALLFNEQRAATVAAVSTSVLWRIDRRAFRYAMAKSSIDQAKEALSFLKKVDLLEGIEDEQLEMVARAVTALTYQSRDTIIRKGEEGHIFYMVKSGTATVKEIGVNFSDVELGPGKYFGEQALFSGDVRGATVVASTACELLALSREDFEQILGPLRSKLDEIHNRRVLESTEFLSELSTTERTEAAQNFSAVEFSKGSIIVSKTEPCESFFIIKTGAVAMTVQEGADEIVLGPGQYFNLSALTKERVDIAECVAKENVILFELTRADFQKAVGGGLQELATRASTARAAELKATEKIDIPKRQLREVGTLGQGTFGRVKLVQDKKSKRIFALKVLHKKEIVLYKQQDNVLNEKKVMMRCHHPFILALYSTYKDAHRLYLLLEYCNGGELFSVLHTTRSDGVPPTSARFYCACAVLALGYLLERSIMYRDLKPENMLIDSQGYVKLIDFGFAKVEADQAYTLCGTPEYMAPEIILGRGYGTSVDWWAMGVLIYECLAGMSPFVAQDQKAICRMIVKGRFSFPKSPAFDTDAKSLINQLLVLNPAKRLASGPSKATPVKAHPWFSSIDWHKLLSKQIHAPWVPTLQNELDTSNFDSAGVIDKVDNSWADPNPGWENDF